MISQSVNQLSTRLERLLPRIRNTAGRVFTTQPVNGLVEFDDIMQSMAIRIIERAMQIPNLLDQTDAFIMIDATRNAGWRVCKSEASYAKRVTPDSAFNLCDEDDDLFSVIDQIMDNAINPEEKLLENELAAELFQIIKNLPEGSIKLLTLSISGLSDTEIADSMGVTKSAISQRRNKIRQQLVQIYQ